VTDISVAPDANACDWPGRLPRGWFAACESRELRGRPLTRTLFDVPVALFRDAQGRAGALVDRCPHRNFPLSEGRVVGETLECRYHGWRFDADGACRAIPALVGDPARFGKAADALAVVERHGLVFVWPTRSAEPAGEPLAPPHLEDPDFTTVRLQAVVPAPLEAAAENILDVPHTAFLHRGLFRTGEARGSFEVITRRTASRVEAEYVGEPRPSGLLGRLLAPRGGVVTHFDRFILPSIAQVEYAQGDAMRVVVTHYLTPIACDVTHIFFVATFRMWLPGLLVAPFVHGVGGRIVAQDTAALGTQSRNVARFGGASFHSTEVDVLGPHIVRLVDAAVRGETLDAAPREWRSRIAP
jgi:phenylpropionate dioxygenase-like ring-hydroxylating dioxygenase large terminal subunit